jgi:hypothetical protein
MAAAVVAYATTKLLSEQHFAILSAPSLLSKQLAMVNWLISSLSKQDTLRCDGLSRPSQPRLSYDSRSIWASITILG